MDSNIVSTLVALLASQKPAAGKTDLEVIGLIIVALMPTIAAVAAFLMARSASGKADASKKSNEETAVSVEKIHVAVNSERTTALAEIKSLRDDILRISKELSEAKGQKQEKEIQIATQAAIGATLSK